MYMSDATSGVGRTLCSRCIDHETHNANGVHVACAVQDCGDIPWYVLEDLIIDRRPFALCRPHFMAYEGIIVKVLRLPELSADADVTTDDPSMALYCPNIEGYSGPRQGQARE